METRKSAPAFNLLDALIIIAALAAVALFSYYFFWSGDKNAVAEETCTIRYVIECKNIRDEFTDCVSVGDSVMDSVKLCPMGTVAAYEYRDSVYRGTISADGSQVVTDYPGRSDMYITVDAKAIKTASAYNVGGFYITVGAPLYMRLPDFYALGYCISLTEID